MKKQKMELVTRTYCDRCGGELTHTNHTIKRYEDGRELDLCSRYTDKIEKTCADIQNEEDIAEYRKNNPLD